MFTSTPRNTRTISLIFFLFTSICVSLTYFTFTVSANPALERLGDGEYCIYSQELIYDGLITKRISTGLGFIYYCDSNNAGALRERFSVIDGESITLIGTCTNTVLKALNYQTVSSFNDGVIETAYAYSTRGDAFIRLGTKKINLQISTRGDTVTVGWPVILGSY